MASKLQEKRSLVRMAQALGQAPDPQLLEDIERLERIENRIKRNIAEDLNEIFSGSVIQEHQVDDVMEAMALIEDTPVQIAPENTPEVPVLPSTVADQVAASISRQLQTEEGTLVRPDAEMPAATAALEQKVKYLENWVSRIAATGPGGGAAEIYNLDMPTTTVTGDYVIKRKDYYIGVSSAVKTYITLPTTGVNLKNGRVVIIKDESGHAQLTPIAIVGTIDNDPNGAEIRINNGTVQLIYQNGWRII